MVFIVKALPNLIYLHSTCKSKQLQKGKLIYVLSQESNFWPGHSSKIPVRLCKLHLLNNEIQITTGFLLQFTKVMSMQGIQAIIQGWHLFRISQHQLWIYCLIPIQNHNIYFYSKNTTTFNKRRINKKKCGAYSRAAFIQENTVCQSNRSKCQRVFEDGTFMWKSYNRYAMT